MAKKKFETLRFTADTIEIKGAFVSLNRNIGKYPDLSNLSTPALALSVSNLIFGNQIGKIIPTEIRDTSPQQPSPSPSPEKKWEVYRYFWPKWREGNRPTILDWSDTRFISVGVFGLKVGTKTHEFIELKHPITNEDMIEVNDLNGYLKQTPRIVASIKFTFATQYTVGKSTTKVKVVGVLHQVMIHSELGKINYSTPIQYKKHYKPGSIPYLELMFHRKSIAEKGINFQFPTIPPFDNPIPLGYNWFDKYNPSQDPYKGRILDRPPPGTYPYQYQPSGLPEFPTGKDDEVTAKTFFWLLVATGAGVLTYSILKLLLKTEKEKE